MKKRILSVLLALLMCAAILPVAAYADNGTIDKWDGTSDTSWYDASMTEFHLQTAEQLAGLAVLVNDKEQTFENKTIYLDNDIDLGGHAWVSIGFGNDIKRYFGGTFDGQYHEIKNLTNTNSRTPYNSLFGVINNGTVRNLGVTGADISLSSETSGMSEGILAGWILRTSVRDCFTTGRITGNTLGGAF